MTLEPGELTRHAAFLGAPGSGKTTVALGLVEQLLAARDPGDPGRSQGGPLLLCPARHGAPSRARRAAGRARRNGCAEESRSPSITPRRSDGRPLSIAAVPAGFGRTSSPRADQAARFAATALAGMMNYGRWAA